MTPAIARKPFAADVDFTADFGREGIHDIVADERVADRVAVVSATEVSISVVDLELAGTDRHVLHDVVERLPIDRRSIDEQIAVLDPRLIVMASRRVAGHGDTNAGCELTVQIKIRGRGVRSMSDPNQLIRIGRDTCCGDENRSRGVAVVEALELLRERSAPLELESVVADPFILGGFEDVDAALVLGAVVLHSDAWRGRQEAHFPLGDNRLLDRINRG